MWSSTGRTSLALAGLSLVSQGLTAPAAPGSNSTCCSSLLSSFPNATYLNTPNQSLQYNSVIQSYFNVPDALPAACFIQPTNTQQISHIVSTLSSQQCPFAVKGGGHMLPIGANGIVDGVTIDLRLMRNTSLSADNTTASVEPGSKWGEVYSYLDAVGYAIPGGRATDVGVAGLTLGGGNSFFAARFGFVCDNVKNFEIVLANGTITNANAESNADLFKALKGGSGTNFGIVTRFDFVAFPSGPLWGGMANYEYSSFAKSLKPFVELTAQLAQGPYGSIIMSWTHNGTDNSTIHTNLYEFTGNATPSTPFYNYMNDPQDQKNPNYPPPFVNFTAALGAPVQNTLRVDTLYNLTNELNSPSGIRNVYNPLTIPNDLAILQKVNSIIMGVVAPTFGNNTPYIAVQAQYQPYPRSFTEHSIQRGGNVLGLDRYDQDTIVAMVLFIWDDPAQDATIHALSDAILGNVTEYTQSLPNAFIPFQYLNYAQEHQDPLGSYGEENVNYLKQVSKKYDPQQVFQNLVPGGWKLSQVGKRNQYNFNDFSKFVAETGTSTE